MTLQQLRCLCEVVDRDYSVSRAAAALHTSQPAVSKLVKQLEQQMGAELFVRARGRVAGLTEIGRDVHELARRMLRDAAALNDLAAERARETSGVLRIGTTHLHARYALLDVITAFTRAYPDVHLDLTQGNPDEIMAWVAAGTVQLGVSTLPEAVPPSVLTLPAYVIERCIITPLKHPLLKAKRLTLREIAKYPLITYDRVFNSGSVVLSAFEKQGLQPRVAMKATDANVIKAYVAAGLGISVFQKMAHEPAEDRRLAVLDPGALFPASQAFISLRRGQYLRGYAYDFIARVAPKWSRAAVDRELKAG
ncbi:MAG: LysR family transcriptional regulator [Burkholderiales bacterium]|nr:LysR family transcriptional regulator [Burkholderiales bacterium]